MATKDTKDTKWRKILGMGAALALLGSSAVQGVMAADVPPAGAAILQELKSFDQMGSVLMVAAHPDDENTQLLAYLARGRNYRTGYLSITRGDGGQNLLGPEFGPELGAIRTQELLAARRIDGAQQFFTRAIDFGFSKSVEDTLKVWNEGGDQKVLADVVQVIRTFRPDVIVTRFSTQASNTHGHHTASAVLALEAFKEAGDAKAFPEQLATLKVWKATRIFMNRGGGGGGGAATGVQMDVGGTDPVTGSGFGMVAGHSRAMHKTQGFGNAGRGSGAWGSGPKMESFVLLDGEPAAKDIMDGVDTTWGRVAGGGEVGKLADAVIAGFDVGNPNASVGALMELRAHLAALPADSIVDEKRRLLDRIVQQCAGITVETTVAQAEVVPGEILALHHEVKIAAPEQIRWVGVRYPSISREVGAVNDSTKTLPATTPVSQPYWLREEGTKGVFRVDDAGLIGRPENLPVFPVEYVFEVRGQTVVIPDEPVQVIAGKEETRRRLDVIPPVTIAYPFGVRLFSPGGTKRVDVELTAYRKGTGGTLRLEVPAGWRAVPEEQKFELAGVGEKKTLSFDVSAPSQPGTADILAKAVVDGVTYSNERVVIDYPHIPRILLQPAARLKAVDVDLAIRGKEVGYLAGAGDSVAASLEQMGYSVTQISGADLTIDGLKKFDAVVVGIRAFNVRQDLAAHVQGLFDFAANGGTVVVQYNTPGGLQTATLGPYELKLSGDLPHNRVTDEHAAVTLLEPEHAAFNVPNKIGPADFEGWVQERGLNFPSAWDGEHFVALLACSDAGEAPLKSGLLVAKCGKGYFVYTGLSFFRQLPAGVPGAYRLMANLVSLGK